MPIPISTTIYPPPCHSGVLKVGINFQPSGISTHKAIAQFEKDPLQNTVTIDPSNRDIHLERIGTCLKIMFYINRDIQQYGFRFFVNPIDGHGFSDFRPANLDYDSDGIARGFHFDYTNTRDGNAHIYNITAHDRKNQWYDVDPKFHNPGSGRVSLLGVIEIIGGIVLAIFAAVAILAAAARLRRSKANGTKSSNLKLANRTQSGNTNPPNSLTDI